MNTARTVLENKLLYKFRHIKKDPKEPSKADVSSLNFIQRIFTHHELHLPCPLDLNDPLDCRPSFAVGDLSDQQYKERFVSHVMHEMLSHDSSKKPDEVTSWLNSLPQNIATKLAIEQMNGYRKEMENSLRICSFCGVPDNPIVWSHYADSHKGFCLVFDASNDLFGEAAEVSYQKEYPTIDVTEENLEVIFANTVLVKYQGWEYETEFRLSSKEPGNHEMLPVKNKKFVFPSELLVGVILGCQISNPDRHIIEEFCKGRPNGFIRKAELNNDKYELSIRDI